MPLRAKILPRAQISQMSTKRETLEELCAARPGDEPEDVLFNSLYGLRTVQLNRPKKLNSLNGSMVRKILPRLVEWEKSDMANVIVMKGAGEKAFCAGGDVASLAEANRKGPDGQKESADYFALEYKLDHLISTLRKPYIAFMDGITMGGGVGLSVHAPFRVATEKTVFAMPETTIGFFPDVGGSFFLPRMAGATGTYLALTSARLKGANVFYSGIATHYLHSTSLANLESRLAELRFNDSDSMDTRLSVINATIEEFKTGLPHDEPIYLAGELRKAIDRCFSHSSVNEILAALEAETGPTQEWAQQTIKTLHERSPTSVHVTLRQMQVGKQWSIAETFKREQQIAAKFMAHNDFTEGVTALLINKTKNPKWTPATLEDVKENEDLASPFFEVSDDMETMQLVYGRDFREYPYRGFALPSERDVESLVSEGTLSRNDVVSKLLERTGRKQGVVPVVKEILERKTIVNENGKAVWQY
ncbi:ClpP/crotonase [Coniochaeta ligniaria NRRL 30616]|uniref:3-hydroxyisobutyryl-CoA hydrolase n=1 Tax=Coniochaeta ligniaria NRRL 30616 TaxID=1408157 RepID=A0A1J7JP92_9PEZI|nr:ClpP/crotonase [Coniochaeta ligniaria NRRL 30616]